jgi:AraC-like DNA-binding protein
MTIIERAKAADAKARDMIAIALDRHLSNANLVRSVASRMLTRPIAKAGGSLGATIAAEMHWSPDALRRAVAREGAAPLGELRRRMILVRIAAIFQEPASEHDSAMTWGAAADALGCSSREAFLVLVARTTGSTPRHWRETASLARAFAEFDSFLAQNSSKWAKVPLRRQECPHCRAILRSEIAA